MRIIVGYDLLKVDKFETVDEVVFAKPGDMNFLRLKIIERFAAVVNKKITCCSLSNSHTNRLNIIQILNLNLLTKNSKI